MKARTLMVQGTASNVGKSIIVAALCRIFRQDGFRVAPFKSQNMALNSYVTVDGGEMGRAQVVQAQASGIEPSVDMNPILLKPEADARSQVVLLGKAIGSLRAGEYFQRRHELWPAVVSAFRRLESSYDIIVIEGAGSPAEVNLQDSDIVNMSVARMARAPVLLVGDIDRGGVFASLLGTLALLSPRDRRRVRGLVINKFRGDVSLLEPGLRFLEGRARRPVLGVVPYSHDIRIAEEDSVALEQAVRARHGEGLLDIVVIRLPHISNFDDFDALKAEAVGFRYVSAPTEMGGPDLIILPGTKTTVADLQALRKTGLAERITELARLGTPVIGICGGFQMLGERILDPDGAESRDTDVPGLGLLPVHTTFLKEKRTRQARGRILVGRGLLAGARGASIRGYEIHLGQTAAAGESPIAIEDGIGDSHPDGCLSADGWVLGTYLHGLFDEPGLRRAILENVARRSHKPLPAFSGSLSGQDGYDKLAELVRGSLTMNLIYEISGLARRQT